MLKWKNTLFFVLTGGAKVTARDSKMVAASSLVPVSGKRNWKNSIRPKPWSQLTSCTNKQEGLVTKFMSWRWGVYWRVQMLPSTEALPSSTFILSFFLFTDFASPPVGFSSFCRLQFVPLLPADRAWGEQCLLLFWFHNGWHDFLQKTRTFLFLAA